jgi:hypothetical protein
MSLSKLRLYFQFRNQAHNWLDSTLMLAAAGIVGNQPVSLFFATPRCNSFYIQQGTLFRKKHHRRNSQN